jgi:hypothetical protein
MGGRGSGRRLDSKETTSAYSQLDVRDWQRERLLVPGRTFYCYWWKVQVSASLNAIERPIQVFLSPHRRLGQQQSFWLAWSRFCGGARAWFLCRCGRRCAILYGSRVLACRCCLDLAYDSQQESPRYRELHRAQAIRRRLGGSGSLAEQFPERPKHMPWRTYIRLLEKAGEREKAFFSYRSSDPRGDAASLTRT